MPGVPPPGYATTSYPCSGVFTSTLNRCVHKFLHCTVHPLRRHSSFSCFSMQKPNTYISADTRNRVLAVQGQRLSLKCSVNNKINTLYESRRKFPLLRLLTRLVVTSTIHLTVALKSVTDKYRCII